MSNKFSPGATITSSWLNQVDDLLNSYSGAGVTSFNTRTGAITLSSSDVTSALGYTPQVTGSYAPATSGSSLLSGNGSGGFSNVTIGSGLSFSAGTLSASTPTVTWGSITGTLSSQTDLNSALAGKQATLVSGTNIKTVGGVSLLGSGDISVGGTGTVTSVSGVNANGFNISVNTPTTTPSIVISTAITGILKGNGTTVSAATAGTDYAAATTGTAAQLLANNGVGGFSNVTVGSGLTLSAGTLSASAGNARTTLQANTTYYVATTGNDSNPGTSGSPFLTIQKAVDVASAFDLNGYTVTISVADGTYSSAVVLKKFVGAGGITIQGNTTTPANCLVSVSGGTCFYCDGVTGYTVTGFKLTGNIGIAGYNYGVVRFGNINFGAMTSYGIYAATGAAVLSTSSFSITAASVWFIYTSSLGVASFTAGTTITITGTPAFSGGFINADRLSEVVLYGITFSGSATGIRYQVVNNSVVFTNSGGATYLPGDTAGTTGTGGQYV